MVIGNKSAPPDSVAKIAALAIFNGFTPAEISDVAQLFTVKHYPCGAMIVKQYEPVTFVAVIVDGAAEVVQSLPQHHAQVIATLKSGETIGLSSRGFYSRDGQRTASVVATADSDLLVLTVADFDKFLLQRPHLYKIMDDNAETLFCMDFIRQVAPGGHLSEDDIRFIAQRAEKSFVPANTTLFRQGDPADKCYLVRSGEVKITFKLSDNHERELAILHQGEIFGETALLTDAPRNANAYTLTPCFLLVISNTLFQAIMDKHIELERFSIALLQERSRPVRVQGITHHIRTTADLQKIITLKDPVRKTYFRLSQEGFFIWQRLDGEHTLRELTLELLKEFKIFSPKAVLDLVTGLDRSGFAAVHTGAKKVQMSSTGNVPLLVRILVYLRPLMEKAYFFSRPDKKITAAYQGGVRFLYTWYAQIMMVLIIVLGLGFFMTAFSHSLKLLHSANLLYLWLSILPITVFSVILHELGHAFTTKAFGYEVHKFGIGWVWLSPVVFTDTSDMWLSPKGPRMAVNLAGIYTDATVAGIASLVSVLLAQHHHTLSLILWAFSLITYINIIRNLNPLSLLDGYYVLSDILDAPHLRNSAVLWLVEKVLKRAPHAFSFRHYKHEMIYWLAGLFYLMVFTGLIIIVQNIFMDVLHLSPHPGLRILFPIAMLILSTLSIWAEIRKLRQN